MQNKNYIKKALKIVIIVFALIIFSNIIDYYWMPFVTFNAVEEGDELIKNGDKVYIIKKDRYERGDIVITNDVSWKDKRMYQVSRKIVGLPDEYIEDGGVSLHNNQYAVRTAVTNSELQSVFRDVISASNIIGMIPDGSAIKSKSSWAYLISRTKYIPEYIKLKLSSSVLSLFDKAGREVPTVSRTIMLASKNEGDFIVENEVVAGDRLWELIRAELLSRDDLKTDKEIDIEVDKIKDSLKAMPSDKLKEIGFSSGDTGILKVGDRIKILEIIGHYNIENNKIAKNNSVNNGRGFICGADYIKDFDNNSYPTVLIGKQCWMAKNLNVGVRIDDRDKQSNNNVIEKHCYNNNEVDCADFGGLYQWDEMMQYSAIEKARGVCPEGWHIPTDVEYYSLEKYFSTGTCDSNRSEKPEDCFSAGSILKKGGSSKFDIVFAGSRYEYGMFAHLWSSSESGDRAWHRGFVTNSSGVTRTTISKGNALAVRCLKD